MGELDEYYIVLSVVKYNDDPMFYGRVKCDIPSVIHEATSMKKAMPWVRPYKMYGYQTFTKPNVGQKIWVLVNKTNYNEFWWFPFYETLDFVQEFIKENYDNQPDVMHARKGSNGNTIFSYDDVTGYMLKYGEDYINLTPNRDIFIAGNDCRMKIDGNKVYCGAGDDTGGYEPCVMGHKCENMRRLLSGFFKNLEEVSKPNPYTSSLSPFFGQIASNITNSVVTSNLYVN